MRSILTKADFLSLAPEGYLCAANAAIFQQQLSQSLSSVSSPSQKAILVDMSKVEFLDSAGLMCLVSAYRLAKELGKRFSICSLNPSVKMIFELTQLDQSLEIFESPKQFEEVLTAA
ncbi:MAG: anti-sigma factor antagonist [Gloeocapsa sp. DLM2.Bin57]|nr:MAG: anti-sigma factor antagonist [Gloeocapsa sp. DLM2.Bin57]